MTGTGSASLAVGATMRSQKGKTEEDINPSVRAARVIRNSAVDVHAYGTLLMLGLGCRTEALVPACTRILYC